MRFVSPRNRHRAGLVMSLVLVLGLGLGPGVISPSPARAARIASKVVPARQDTTGQGTPSPGARLEILASQVAASRSNSAAKTGSTSTRSAVPTMVPQTGPMIPASITDPITKSKLLKDFEHLVALKSGKLANWNQQTLKTLENDLGITTPGHVAPRLAAAKPVLAAQEINGSTAGSGATALAAPVPEPGSLLIFALALGGLAVRHRYVRRVWY